MRNQLLADACFSSLNANDIMNADARCNTNNRGLRLQKVRPGKNVMMEVLQK